MRGANREHKARSRSLRRSSTQAESAFWKRIRNRQLGGFKFVRQEPVGPYYADFVCRERHLIVELDGGQHADDASDHQRDRELAALGYRVIRIWNNDLLGNINGVLDMLATELRK